MILVLGGTTEGRNVVESLDKAGKKFFYSTRTNMQEIQARNAFTISGGMDTPQMREFCEQNEIKLIIDAAHPFANLLHTTVHEVSAALSIPVIRYERRYATHDPDLHYCTDFDDAVNKLISNGVKRLLALTGVQTISKLKGYWHNQDCYFRILDRKDSRQKADAAGVTPDKLVFYEKDGAISDLIESVEPDAIITKESGDSGGFSAKVEEAKSHGLKVFVIRRPSMPEGFIPVYGNYRLRREVERLLPGFFDLRSGFTTGSCATAAAKAAMLALVCDEVSDFVSFSLPDGEEMRMKVEKVEIINPAAATATVVKDAGDDPDVTDGCIIEAKVQLSNHREVHFHGGEGIGTVTLPGIGLEIGEPAINPVPRQMMRRELLAIYPQGCDVTISVPGGEEIAKRTFNSRIGIQGGISIIGTSGIVMPLSNEAFMEAIRREMEVAMALGCNRIVLNSGARSEKSVRSLYPELPQAAFIHYGNAIGEALTLAEELGIKQITLGIMIGKAVKLAEGYADTHSHKVVMNREFIHLMARAAGCSDAALQTISHLNMAQELWTELSEDDSGKFFPHLLSECKMVCRKYFTTGSLTMALIKNTGEICCINHDVD